MEPMPPIKKTLALAAAMSGATSFIAAFIQLGANKKVSSCSYLDPVIIDITAFTAGCFLVVESLVDIFYHRDSPVSKQLTRCVRMAFGSAIVTIHVLQFVHK